MNNLSTIVIYGFNFSAIHGSGINSQDDDVIIFFFKGITRQL